MSETWEPVLVGAILAVSVVANAAVGRYVLGGVQEWFRRQLVELEQARQIVTRDWE